MNTVAITIPAILPARSKYKINEHAQAMTAATTPSISQLIRQWASPMSMKLVTAIPIPNANQPNARALYMDYLVLQANCASMSCTSQNGLCSVEALAEYP